MLMVEFKLFALRHPRVRAKLAHTHGRIRASMSLDAIQRLLRNERSRSGSEEIKAALEGTLSGLVLEQSYDPKRISEEQVSAVLRRVFQMLTASE